MQINIALVSYQNTIPFLYGLQHSENKLNVNLLLTPPFKCAENLKNHKADIALIPAIKLLEFSDIHIFSSYCIAASEKVYSVALFSNTPVEQLTKIYLDTDSRTSVELLKILTNEYWLISPEWASLNSFDLLNSLDTNEGCLLIGDKVFQYEDKFTFKYDLAEYWYKHTGTHFVFAVWVAKNIITKQCEESINSALRHGVENIDKAICEYGGTFIPTDKLRSYLNNNIEFEFTKEKKNGLELFLSKVKEPSSERA